MSKSLEDISHGLYPEPEKAVPPKRYFTEVPLVNTEENEEVPDAEVIEEKDGIKTLDYRGYKVLSGGHYSTIVFDKIQQNSRNGEANIFCVSGKNGIGKSWMALRLCEILDSHFDCHRQITFDSDRLLYLVSDESPLRKHQAILIDEAHHQAGARHWMDSLQKDLMDSLLSVRSKQLILVIVITHPSLLDNLLRENAITWHLIVTQRGKAKFYETIHGDFVQYKFPKKIAQLELQMPSYEQCRSEISCLDCKYAGLSKTLWSRQSTWAEEKIPICYCSRAVYERMKKSALEKSNKESREKVKAAKRISDDNLVGLLLPHIQEIELMKNGKYSTDSVIAVCADKLNTQVSRVKSYQIRDKLARKIANIGGV